MNEDKVSVIVKNTFCSALRDRDIEVPQSLDSEFVLLASGLDSLGFAILVTRLEDALGYDPFTLMDEPVYPRTYGEFEEVYIRFSDHLKPNASI